MKKKINSRKVALLTGLWVDSKGKKVPYIDWLHSHDETAKHQFARFLQYKGKTISSNQDKEHHTFCMQDIT